MEFLQRSRNIKANQSGLCDTADVLYQKYKAAVHQWVATIHEMFHHRLQWRAVESELSFEETMWLSPMMSEQLRRFKIYFLIITISIVQRDYLKLMKETRFKWGFFDQCAVIATFQVFSSATKLCPNRRHSGLQTRGHIHSQSTNCEGISFDVDDTLSVTWEMALLTACKSILTVSTRWMVQVWSK